MVYLGEGCRVKSMSATTTVDGVQEVNAVAATNGKYARIGNALGYDAAESMLASGISLSKVFAIFGGCDAAYATATSVIASLRGEATTVVVCSL